MEKNDYHIDELFPLETNFRPVVGTCLFRSASPDDWNEAQVKSLQDIGVKAIIDNRAIDSVWVKQVSSGDVMKSALEKSYPSYRIQSSSDSPPELLCVYNIESPTPGCYKHIYNPIFGTEFNKAIFWSTPFMNKFRILRLGISHFLFGDETLFEELASLVFDQPKETQILTMYKSMISYAGAAISSALRLLIQEESTPALICCAAGKDRTGIVAALVQHVCEVRESLIYEDYAKSKHLFENNPAFMSEKTRVRLDVSCHGAEEETMMNLFTFIKEKYGSIDGYLDSIGFNGEDRRSLRELCAK